MKLVELAVAATVSFFLLSCASTKSGIVPTAILGYTCEGPTGMPVTRPITARPFGLVAAEVSTTTDDFVVEAKGFEKVAVAQQKDNWCAAAAIDSVLRYRGISIPQDQIADGLVNSDGAYPLQILYVFFDLAGGHIPDAPLCNPLPILKPTPQLMTEAFAESLRKGRPVIMGISNDLDVRHVVVAYRAILTTRPLAVRTVTVYDPAPSREHPDGRFFELTGQQARDEVDFVIGADLILP